MRTVIKRHAVTAAIHAEHAFAAAHDLFAIVETEAETDFIPSGVVTGLFLDEILPVLFVADAQRRLFNDRCQLAGCKYER